MNRTPLRVRVLELADRLESLHREHRERFESLAKVVESLPNGDAARAGACVRHARHHEAAIAYHCAAESLRDLVTRH